MTETLLAEASPGDRLLAEQKWSSWFELTVPGVPVMVDVRIELFDEQIWADYLNVIHGHADWADILRVGNIDLVAIDAADEQLRPFIGADPGWELVFEDDEGAVYRRTRGAS